VKTIYFSGSISGGRRDVPLYRRIVAAMEAEGHRVLAGNVIADHIGDEGEPLEPAAIFGRDLRWIDEADVLVAEVSMPSTGVGYEIAAARYRNRMPVIALYRPAHTRRCTAMVAGDEAIRLIEYSDDSIDAMLEKLSVTLRE
ncbi:MAG TPA: nucleoside 2-deoxyribosyltransferase, partial [Thermoanaerobaculia bacterium]|jgi:hypothetical protein|nr:nucleoside 2-deoxyribosyltransferase [Thermoanaerobaculia bacterium]